MEIKIIPIVKWTGKKNSSPRPSQFKATYSDTLKILKFELEKADIYGDAQLQMFVRPEEMRLDGNMRANAKPYEQGVKLVFKRLGERFFDEKEQKWKAPIKTVSYPCDTFNSWQDNLRGIALSMAALRQVERYGVFKYSDIMERLALPSSVSNISNAEEAAQFISRFSGIAVSDILRNPDILKKAYRAASKILHPDKGGNHGDFTLLNQANNFLTKHFGL